MAFGSWLWFWFWFRFRFRFWFWIWPPGSTTPAPGLFVDVVQAGAGSA